MKKQIIYLFIVCLLFASSKIYAQDVQNIELQNKLTTYASKHLFEKIYVHTDKNTYLNNEMCWFKIYSLEGLFNTPLNISTICYVEILDDQYQPVIQEKVNMVNGMGNGSIAIPNNLTSGNYIMRAYTNWMKNFDAQFFFSKPIKIINTQIPLKNIEPTNKTNLLSIYPESGSLINGIENKVGIKLIKENGKGLASKGWLIEDKKDTLTTFSSSDDGIGSFIFIPKLGHQYNLKTIASNGIENVKEITGIQEKGYHLAITEDKINNQIHIGVFNNMNENANVFLLIHTRGILKKAFTINRKNSDIVINNADLGEGINSITLFDSSKRPVSERLVFNFPKNTNLIQANTEVNQLRSREKVNLKLQGSNNALNDQLNLSMSVYKIDSLQGINETNIQNYVWLQSDLSEKIEQPFKYFDTTRLTRFLEMDNLMLTNGWRKFNWEQVLANEPPLFHYIPEIAGNIIIGKLDKGLTSNKNNEITASISYPSKFTQNKGTSINQNGVGVFEFKKIYNDGQIILQVDSPYHKSKFTLENPFYVERNNSKNTNLFNENLNKIELNNNYRDIQVQNYYNAGLTNQFNPIIADSTAFYGKADRVYLLDNYSRFATLEEVIREYVTPLSLTKSDGKFKLSVYDEATKQFFKEKPLLLLDGVKINDVNKFLTYDPLKIRKLEVVSRLYYDGNNKYNGIINFTTYEGKMEGYELDPSSIVLDYKGLQANRIFAAPVYDTQNEIENRLPDFRHLLYWNPTISIKGNETKQISFFTSDLKGNFLISIQGISNKGIPVYQQIKMDVK
jgi:hypothetical protein